MQTIYDTADDVVVIDRLPVLNEKNRPGTYILRFEQAIAANSKKTNKPFFKAIFTVVKSEGEGAHPVGAEVAHFITEDPYGYFIKDMKRLVGALTGTKASAVTKANIEELTQSDNPAAGVLVRAKVAPKSESSSFLVVTYESASQE